MAQAGEVNRQFSIRWNAFGNAGRGFNPLTACGLWRDGDLLDKI
jgi:hypothetical protein